MTFLALGLPAWVCLNQRFITLRMAWVWGEGQRRVRGKASQFSVLWPKGRPNIHNWGKYFSFKKTILFFSGFHPRFLLSPQELAPSISHLKAFFLLNNRERRVKKSVILCLTNCPSPATFLNKQPKYLILLVQQKGLYCTEYYLNTIKNFTIVDNNFKSPT